MTALTSVMPVLSVNGLRFTRPSNYRCMKGEGDRCCGKLISDCPVSICSIHASSKISNAEADPPHINESLL